MAILYNIVIDWMIYDFNSVQNQLIVVYASNDFPMYYID